MSVFNLKKWMKQAAKKDTPTVTEKQLRDIKPKSEQDNNDITEKKLEDYRTEGEAKTTEQRLEKVRTGSEEMVTEGRLDKAGDWHRNEATHTGNVPKLEEKRLKGEAVKNDPARPKGKEVVEEQEAKNASVTPDDFRIEKMKSGNDGLKLASLKKKQQVDIDAITDADDFLEGEFEDEADIEDALSEFDMNEIPSIEDDEDWEAVQKDLLLDTDVLSEVFEEQVKETADPDTQERFLSGTLEFNQDDPLFKSKGGGVNVDTVRQKAVEFLRRNHPEFMITEDNLDLSGLSAGNLKFLATEGPIS